MARQVHTADDAWVGVSTGVRSEAPAETIFETRIGAPGGTEVALDFAALVRGHQAMVFSIALHFLADRSGAEEMAQDVFLQLHTALPTLKSEDHVTFWLRKVTSHRCIDYKRSRRWVRKPVSLDDAPEPAAPAYSGDPFLARKLRRLVGTLPRKARLVVILRYQEDLPPEEIAELLAMPVATVKSHLQRSLALLREKTSRAL